MSNYEGIEAVLINSVLAIDAITPIEFPNAELENSQKGSLWLAIHNLRSVSTPATLGDAGEDNHPGVLQIDINIPLNSGSGPALDKADQFLSSFTAGKTLAYNGQEVRVQSSSLSPARRMGGYYRISVSVTYYARTTRS